MASVNATGGLDVASIVSQLMAIERQPLQKMQKEQSQYQTQVSAYGKLKSSLDAFRTAMDALSTVDKFELYKATSSDEKVVTATTDASATAGSYNITVGRLAQNHKMASAEYAGTDTFGGGDAADALTFTVGSDSFSVNIYNGGAGMTLSEIRDAINNAADNVGVTAAVVTGNNGNQKLILTSGTSGYDNRIQMSYSGSVADTTLNLATANTDSLGATLADLTNLDASITVDGYSMTRSSNKIDDVLTGVTLSLVATGSMKLEISRDNSGVKDAVQSFVDKYNEVQKTLNTLRSGDLKGDSTLLSIESQLRNVLNTGTASGTFRYLSEVGVGTNKADGMLKLDSTTLESALNTDFAAVASLFGNTTDGVAMRFVNTADTLLEVNTGVIDSRTAGIKSRIELVTNRQDNFQYRLTLIEERLRKQYTALDSMLGQMSSMSGYLSAQFASLK